MSAFTPYWSHYTPINVSKRQYICYIIIPCKTKHYDKGIMDEPAR